MTIYYVYAYLREDQTPYYIGKGKGDRAYDNSDHKKHGIYLPEDRSRIIILQESLTNEQAMDLETELIQHYGRKDLGTGILHNKTDGGVNPILYGERNGMTNQLHTEETKDLIRKSKLGKPRRNDKMISCSICNTQMRPQGYRQHCNREHPDSNILKAFTIYECAYCDKSYAKGNSLRNHIVKAHPGCGFIKLVNNPAVAPCQK